VRAGWVRTQRRWRWIHAPVCERDAAIGTNFFEAGEECLVGLLVSEDDAEHIWWFRQSGTTEVVWWGWRRCGSPTPKRASGRVRGRRRASLTPSRRVRQSDWASCWPRLSRRERADPGGDAGDDAHTSHGERTAGRRARPGSGSSGECSSGSNTHQDTHQEAHQIDESAGQRIRLPAGVEHDLQGAVRRYPWPP
jgi:hypothetical protein